jgi:flagellar protein FlgJ
MIKQNGMADVYTDFKGLAQLRSQAKSNSPQALKETAKQFESIFIQMALKSMRNATQDSDLMDNHRSRLYRDMYDQQMAVELGKQSGLGLADMLERQLGGGQVTQGRPSGKTLEAYRHEAVPSVRGEPADTIAEERRAAAKIIDKLLPSASAQTTGAVTGKPFDSPEAFVSTLWPHAKEAAADLGVDPKMLLAQAALESGWGKAMVRTADGRDSHNLFGIKADRGWEGPSLASQTVEYADGVAVKRRAAFRAYDSYADSFRDYVGFLKSNPRYARALESADDPMRFIAGLQKAGYATDPNYARKVMSIYQGHKAFEGLSVA